MYTLFLTSLNGETLSDLLASVPIWTIPVALLAILTFQILLFFMISCARKVSSFFPAFILLFGGALLLTLIGTSLESTHRSTRYSNDSSKMPLFHNMSYNGGDQNTEAGKVQAKRMNQLTAEDVHSVSSPSADYRSSSVSQSNTNGVGQFIAPPQTVGGYPSAGSDPVRTSEYTGPVNSGSPIRQAGFDSRTAQIPQDLNAINQNGAILNEEVFDVAQRLNSEKKKSAIIRARAAVVNIDAEVYKDRRRSNNRTSVESGSGFLVKYGDRYYILTNNHVAGRALSKDKVLIKFQNGVQVKPIGIYSCERADIALLELDGKAIPTKTWRNVSSGSNEKDIALSILGDSDKVRHLDEVYSIGSPYGLDGSVARGIISGMDRQDIPLGTPEQIQGFLQTDASVNPGNSGGPLVNSQGEVIGVITAIASKTGQGSGIAFALPINSVNKVVNELIQNGQWRGGYLGIELKLDYTENERAQDGLNHNIGARIILVKEGSPAEEVGLISGDVILSFDGKEVRDEKHLKQMIALAHPGSRPELIVWRDRKEYLATPLLIGQNGNADDER